MNLCRLIAHDDGTPVYVDPRFVYAIRQLESTPDDPRTAVWVGAEPGKSGACLATIKGDSDLVHSNLRACLKMAEAEEPNAEEIAAAQRARSRTKLAPFLRPAAANAEKE